MQLTYFINECKKQTSKSNEPGCEHQRVWWLDANDRASFDEAEVKQDLRRSEPF